MLNNFSHGIGWWLFCGIIYLVIISKSSAQKELTLEDIYVSDKFKIKTLHSVKWLPDGRKFTYYEKDAETSKLNLWAFEVKTGERKILVSSDDISVFSEAAREKRFRPGSYNWSPNGRDILFPSGNALYLYNTKSKQLDQLDRDNEPERDPRFSPDGKRLLYLKRHNIHVLDIGAKTEKQITTHGREHVWVGRFDWVYEEEFGIRTGFFWSPDNRHIAYFEVDERQEPEFPITDFIPVHNAAPTMRYPKPGDKNAIIRIGVVDIYKAETKWMKIGDETDIYIPRIKWLKDGKTLAIFRMNRDQNKLELLFADIETGETRLILTEEEKHGWLSIGTELTFLDDNKHFLWKSDRSNWPHIYLYRLDGTLVRQVTGGEWQVNGINGVDEKRQIIYFTANEKSVLETQLYRIKFDGTGFRRLTKTSGSHSINMSPNCKYYLDNYSSARTPTKIGFFENTGKLKYMIEENNIDAIKEYDLPTKEFLTFETEDGVELNAFMIKPVDFDPGKKYPVLFTTYGGPGSQIVRNSWGRGDLWHKMLTQKGYIIFGVDNRGTGGRGAKFMKQMYRRLGHFEVLDHQNAAKYLRTLAYVDGNRIGIWGWSYGGYTTCMCLLKATGYFRAGVAVASVTDWRNYDSIYTERYMDQPKDNPDGYKAGSTLTYADSLKGKLLLIHGSADDNVHLANTMQLAYELQKQGKVFDMLIYPRKLHGIGGVRMQLFQSITEFILENL